MLIDKNNIVHLPTVQVISDSGGWTAQMIVRAASSQFGDFDPTFELLTDVSSMNEIETFLAQQAKFFKENYGREKLVVFYTLVSRELCAQMEEFLSRHPEIYAVDLMSDALHAISEVSGLCPLLKPGQLHLTDTRYFKRIEAIEFTIAHDDGKRPEDLEKADVVLLGVSRSGKTPTSIFLSQQGLRVANIPLDPLSEPPVQLFDVEPSRIFGLMTTPDVLVGIRQRRLGKAVGVASSYADSEKVYEDLEKARALMRKLGCIVIHTENRAVEETVQEIMSYYMMMHPRSSIN